jgi:polyisoprenyl-teichoic acid--peptidoglycan teichoic acid transferase
MVSPSITRSTAAISIGPVGWRPKIGAGCGVGVCGAVGDEVGSGVGAGVVAGAAVGASVGPGVRTGTSGEAVGAAVGIVSTSTGGGMAGGAVAQPALSSNRTTSVATGDLVRITSVSLAPGVREDRAGGAHASYIGRVGPSAQATTYHWTVAVPHTDQPAPGLAGPLHRSAALAGTLSFVLPGLGQLWAGARQRGFVLLLPVLLLLLVAAGVWIFDRGILVRAVLTPNVLLGLILLNVLLLVYRLWAIVDAYLIGRRRLGPNPGGWIGQMASAVVLVLLLGITSVMHGYVAYVGVSAHQTLIAVFSPEGPRGAPTEATPEPTPTSDPADDATPLPATPTPEPTPTPTPTPDWMADGRLNVLLIGSDAGPGRWSMRADAIILVSIEIDSGRVATFSIPRYTRNVPLPEPAADHFECRCLDEDFINALYVYANQHPEIFPGEDEHSRGFLALKGAVEELTGQQLDGIAVADMNGFVRLVDAIGGVTVDVPAQVYDPAYPDPDGVSEVELIFQPGEQRMDGWEALAYSRTRWQDGDVARMERQQHVMKALQREISCELLFRLPAVLDVARDTLWTTVPLEDVPNMIQIDLGPPESHVLWDVHNPVLDSEEVERVQAAVANAFDGPPPEEPEPLEC